ncbi:hypothetical protein GGG16DRAFT_13516, partial [Schizophyllum commune]
MAPPSQPPQQPRSARGRFVRASGSAGKGKSQTTVRGADDVSSALSDSESSSGETVTARDALPPTSGDDVTESAMGPHDVAPSQGPTATTAAEVPELSALERTALAEDEMAVDAPAESPSHAQPTEGQVLEVGVDSHNQDAAARDALVPRVTSTYGNTDPRENQDNASISSDLDRGNSRDLRDKGKGPDVRNFGELEFDEAEQDPEIQRQLWEAAHTNRTQGTEIRANQEGASSSGQMHTSGVAQLGTLQDEIHRKTMELSDYMALNMKLTQQVNELTDRYDNLMELITNGSVGVRSRAQSVTRDRSTLRQVEQTRDTKEEPARPTIPRATPYQRMTQTNNPEDKLRPSYQGGSESYWDRYMTAIRARFSPITSPNSDEESEVHVQRDKASRLKPQPPEVYDGREDDEAFWTFVIESLQYVTDGLVSEARQADVISRWLTGKAKRFYKQTYMLSTSNNVGLNKFFRDLFDHCFSLNYKDKCRKRYQLCIQDGRDLRDYMHELERYWVVLTEETDRNRVLRFWDGLDSWLVKRLMEDGFNKEIDELDPTYNRALELWLANYAARAQGKSRRPDDSSGPPSGRHGGTGRGTPAAHGRRGGDETSSTTSRPNGASGGNTTRASGSNNHSREAGSKHSASQNSTQKRTFGPSGKGTGTRGQTVRRP